jgi:hypothetical protein
MKLLPCRPVALAERISPTTGSRRSPGRSTAGSLPLASTPDVPVWDQGGASRRSVAMFGARASAAGGTHTTGCRARHRVPSGRGSGPRCSRSSRHPCNNTSERVENPHSTGSVLIAVQRNRWPRASIRVSSEHAAGVLGSSAFSSADCWLQYINKCSQRWTKLVEADSG